MKIRFNYLAMAFLSFMPLVSCQNDDVEEPTLTVTTAKTTYKVGEEVLFNFSGYSDFITIYTGVDNYNAGNVYGKFLGSRYEYRNRISENGRSVLSFNCKKNAMDVLDHASLRLLISSDFQGPVDGIDAIRAATWTDISDRAKWPDASTKAGANVASGQIDISEWNGKKIHVALKYEAQAGVNQMGWTLSSFTLNNYITTDSVPFTIWNNGSAPKFGTTTNILNEDGTSPMYGWAIGTSLTCKGGSGTGTKALESWLISSPVDPSMVDPDYGTCLKSYSSSVPESYSYFYYKPGEYTVTIVSRNTTVYGNKEKVQTINITIEE